MVRRLMDEAFALYNEHLLYDFATCGQQDRAALLHSWQHARDKVRYILGLKFATWEMAPWGLCGVAHRGVPEARRATARTKRAWNASGGAGHHTLMVELFRDEVFNQEIDAFIGGAELVTTPNLHRLSLRLRCILCHEMSIERVHRTMSIQLEHDRTSGGQVLSLLSGRRNEIVRNVIGDPSDATNRPTVGTMEALLGAFDAARNPPGMVRELDLQRHVVWVNASDDHAARGKKFKPSSAHKECAAMIYRYDRESMFLARTFYKDDIDKHNQKRRREIENIGANLMEEFVSEEYGRGAEHDSDSDTHFESVVNRVLCRVLLDHFRDQTSAGEFFTIKARDGAAFVGMQMWPNLEATLF